MTLKCEGGHLDQPVECVASALRVLHLAHAFDRIKLRTGNNNRRMGRWGMRKREGGGGLPSE